jgi:putative RecB family exonuclease
MFSRLPGTIGWESQVSRPTRTIGEWTRERVVSAFRELDENIRAERFEPKPEPSKCRFCSVQLACEFSLA